MGGVSFQPKNMWRDSAYKVLTFLMGDSNVNSKLYPHQAYYPDKVTAIGYPDLVGP